ncbi:MerR family transcriptional regulator [Eggerthellaceae bacterium zg-997]|nr:MerR family transcriptional regulator [Eggerthellaceae bacterium zg-997]
MNANRHDANTPGAAQRRGADATLASAPIPRTRPHADANTAQHRSSAGMTVGQVAELAGISTRTLRHYEDAGLLTPARARNGYRVYAPADVRRLSQIMAMRACGMPLSLIGRITQGSASDLRAALSSHLLSLAVEQRAIADAIARTQAALATIERIDDMDDRQKFEEVKAAELARFEETYGQEARQRYGAEAIEQTNARIAAMSREEWDDMKQLEERVKQQLACAIATGDVQSDEAEELARLHAQWIRTHWGTGYRVEAHLGLAQMYLVDSRFTAYYDDAAGTGATRFLVDALHAHLG